ncbi:DsbA family protein [Aliamphritea hakodatensis]|uniref:DsbA family protein n=1 Tax=Aliamphritea hakodatensis TaxID=2895352 RepID=UPI0022FD6669|nr:DsbA family protein [Aliamphritea hakodatensis]
MSRNYTLHYYFDPLCGWCYGAAPLLNQAKRLAPELAGQDIQLNIHLHPGGLFSQPNCLPVSDRFRAMASHHDARIADLTGQTFGQAYQQELLFDTSRILDSTPPSAAVLAAEALAGKGTEMLHSLQKAHYIDGLDITAEEVLVQRASEVLNAPQDFLHSMSVITPRILERFNDCRSQMQRFNLHGYPGFVLEKTAPASAPPAGPDSNNCVGVINHQPYYGQPIAFADHIISLLT